MSFEIKVVKLTIEEVIELAPTYLKLTLQQLGADNAYLSFI